MAYCCKRFEMMATANPISSGAFTREEGHLNHGSWNVAGCCGGGCYVLSNVRFCPFCGKELTMPVDEKCAQHPKNFEDHVKDAPMDPQAEYKAQEPLVRASSTTGTREMDIYPEQAAGMTPRVQGNIG